VVVIQSDVFNRSRIATIVAAILSSNLDLARAPGNVLLPKTATGLPKDSVANVSQIVAVDRTDLDESATGRLPKPFLDDLDEGLRLVLALGDR
jgi:mRNA interferase MazF